MFYGGFIYTNNDRDDPLVNQKTNATDWCSVYRLTVDRLFRSNKEAGSLGSRRYLVTALVLV